LTYNPFFDLVTGIVLILVPLSILVGFGVWILLSSKEKGRPSDNAPSAKSPAPEGQTSSLHQEIVRLLDSLSRHQERLLTEMRGLSEENRQTLGILVQELERVRNLLEREERAQESEAPVLERNLSFR